MTKYSVYKTITVIALSVFLPSLVEAAQAKKPNIVFIYADDLGKGMLSAYGQKQFTTPHIDALINGGVDFSRAYGGSETAQARASLLTGYHDCTKSKWRIANGGVYIKEDTMHIHQNEDLINQSQILLPENDPYLPQIFARSGYVTAQIGMLGIGNTSTRKQMAQQGWDYFYGYLDHVRSRGYYPMFLFENEQITPIKGNTRVDGGKNFDFENEQTFNQRWNMEGKETYAPDLFINKTIEFIREFKDKPFFLMYSSPLPHGPVSIPKIDPEIAANNDLTPIEKEYASMVKLLDDHVGRIISCLRELGLEEQTIIVFSSDNGHDVCYQQEGRVDKLSNKKGERFDDTYNKYYSSKSGDIFNGNASLAGLKRSNLEGGVCVPLVVYRKGVLDRRTCSEVVAGYDLLPTMADLLNIKLPASKSGVSYLPALTKSRKLPAKRYVVVASDEGPALISNDGWKLRYNSKIKKYELYNLSKDLEEKYDVILRYPEIAETLKRLLLKECDGDLANGMI